MQTALDFQWQTNPISFRHGRRVFPIVLVALLAACQPAKEYSTTGSLVRIDPDLDKIITTGGRIEVIAHGFEWSEGPVWIPNQKTLIFSDVIRNTIYSWTEEKGTSVYLTPSGYTGISPRGGEPGSNGLLIDPEGRLILCQHGDRRIALMESSLNDPRPEFKTLANSYRGKKFDSPNDIVRDSKGNFYFTDPPYGLAGGFQDSTKAAPYQGVYQLTPSGNVYLLIDTLTRPNGITLSPDGRFLFVGNSDGNRARWYRYALGDTSVVSGKVFYDAHGEGGAPDGMKMDHAGNLYSTGPGGVWIFNADAKVLGKLKIPQATSNIALSDDERTLFITADSLILRLKMR